MNTNSKSLLLATLSLCGIGFAINAGADDVADLAEGSAPLQVEYEREDVEWSRYDKLIIDDLDVSDTRIIPPPWTDGAPFKWEIDQRNIDVLQREYHASMSEQISGNGGYEIVTEPGEGVAEISLEIVSFMPYAQRKEKVITKGSGEMQISVRVRDTMSGDLLAIYEGPQEVGSDYNENTDFSRQQNLKKLFDTWGARVRLGMDSNRR